MPGAIFCVECGHALGSPCPQCGTEVGGCDFCEACGLWLKPGCCRFCYAELPEGAAFCVECSADQLGLSCTRCGTRGFFDFCSDCGDALSDLALGLMQAPPQDAALAQALQQLRQIGTEIRDDVGQARPPSPAAKPRFDLSGARRSMQDAAARDAASAEQAREQAARARQEAQASAAEAAVQAAQAAREEALRAARQQEMAQSEVKAFGLSLRLKEARERIQALMAVSDARSFPDAQSARRYFMQIRSQLVGEGQTPTKWLCNWATCKHDNPNECGNPSLGGRWLFE